ncbi:hypothetical protein Trydic_g21220 [Trypoxylus dichotomus]
MDFREKTIRNPEREECRQPSSANEYESRTRENAKIGGIRTVYVTPGTICDVYIDEKPSWMGENRRDAGTGTHSLTVRGSGTALGSEKFEIKGGGSLNKSNIGYCGAKRLPGCSNNVMDEAQTER